jgi:hypothetical protein
MVIYHVHQSGYQVRSGFPLSTTRLPPRPTPCRIVIADSASDRETVRKPLPVVFPLLISPLVSNITLLQSITVHNCIIALRVMSKTLFYNINGTKAAPIYGKSSGSSLMVLELMIPPHYWLGSTVRSSGLTPLLLLNLFARHC